MAWYTVDGHFYCPACIKVFIQPYHQKSKRGPFNTERAIMMHCERGGKCVDVIQTSEGKIGACLVELLTATGRISIAIDLDLYVKRQRGVPEILDVHASILGTHPLDGLRSNILQEYLALRKTQNMTCQVEHKPQVDCKSCKGTGIILGFNKTYSCLDCKTT